MDVDIAGVVSGASSEVETISLVQQTVYKKIHDIFTTRKTI